MTATYIDLALEWRTTIPHRWSWMRNKELLFEAKGLSSDGTEELLSVSHLTGVGPRSEKNVTMTSADSLGGYRLVETGDLVINTMWAWMGALGVANQPGIVSPAYGVYRPHPAARFEPRFFNYLYRSPEYLMEMTRISRGIWSSRLRIYPEAFLRMAIPVPPLTEQRAIADYLDRETARVDALIEEQQSLIEMVCERRAGLISHAVLDNPSPKVQLRRLVDVVDCAHVTAEFVDDDRRFPVASIRECQRAVVDLSACNYTTAEFFEHLRAGDRAPRAGDLLFVRNVSVGLVSVVTPALPAIAMGQETVLLRRKSDVHPGYLRYALVGAEARHAIDGAMIGSTFRRINVSAIRSLEVPTPPIDDQRRIAEQLDKQTSTIDQLIAETERFIELSRERRAALITAAVTGQIDVRKPAS